MHLNRKSNKKGFKLIGIVIVCLIMLLVIAVGIVFALRNRINWHKKLKTQENNGTYSLNANDGIASLESGLSVVRFDGDYGFDDFLAQGGSDNDSNLLEFIKSYTGNDKTSGHIETEGFGCSTVYAPKESGGYLFGRNFDFIKCNAMIVESHPKTGYSSISTVDLDFIHLGTKGRSLLMKDDMLTLAALYVPLDGMNEKGVCMSVNMIQDGRTIHQDTNKPDLTTTTAIRLVLDKAANVDEAIELLSQYDLHASFNFMVHFAIADAQGRSVVIEYIENEMVVTDTSVVTNFYLAQGDLYGVGTSQSMERYQILLEALNENAELTSEGVRDCLDKVSKHNYDDGETTEWSVVYDLNAHTACYYHREDYSKGYTIKLNVKEGK